jgi:hypothetical protein
LQFAAKSAVTSWVSPSVGSKYGCEKENSEMRLLNVTFRNGDTERPYVRIVSVCTGGGTVKIAVTTQREGGLRICSIGNVE